MWFLVELARSPGQLLALLDPLLTVSVAGVAGMQGRLGRSNAAIHRDDEAHTGRMEAVESARVHLVIPQPTLFTSQAKEPTASVILHFCDTRPYPVLDYRALWSLGYSRPPVYTFEFWSAYTHFTRALAQSTGHDMRTVDRALWQYSKHHQR